VGEASGAGPEGAGPAGAGTPAETAGVAVAAAPPVLEPVPDTAASPGAPFGTRVHPSAPPAPDASPAPSSSFWGEVCADGADFAPGAEGAGVDAPPGEAAGDAAGDARSSGGKLCSSSARRMAPEPTVRAPSASRCADRAGAAEAKTAPAIAQVSTIDALRPPRALRARQGLSFLMNR